MRAKIGDVVIDRTYNKKENLAIVVGEGISQPILIDHKGGITMDKLRDYFSVWDGLEVIGHIDFEKIWEEAVHTANRKTESHHSGEVTEMVEPQTCESCKHHKLTCDLYSEICKYEPKDKPQTEYPCNTCANKGDHNGECSNCFMSSEPIRWETPSHYKPKDEPKTERGGE